MKRQIIPGVIDGQQELCSLAGDATVQAAAELMAERRVGAVMVVEHGRLLGIVTERDIVFRVVAKSLAADATTLADVMTSDPESLSPQDTAFDALEKMQTGRYRHLPVLRDQEVCGMVSMRDIYEAVRRNLQEELRGAEALIYGDQYGGASSAS
jgi:CBS domain-containing protein